MKIITCGIIGWLAVLSIVVGFIALSDTQYDTIEKQDIHPCQQSVFNYVEVFNEFLDFDYTTETLEDIELLGEVYDEMMDNASDQYEQEMIDNNCAETVLDWYTNEYNSKLEFYIEYGFLPR